jgi:hypothetical protein
VQRIPLAVLAQRDRPVGRRLRDPGDPGPLPAVEHRRVLADGQRPRRRVECSEVDVLGAAVGVCELDA